MNVATVRIGDVVGFVDLVEKRKPAEVCTPQLWYVLQTWPGKEAKVMRKLEDCGVAAYCPRVRRAVTRRGRKVDLTDPLFAQLIFLPDYVVTDHTLSLILHFDGVDSLLTFGRWTATLPEQAPEDRPAVAPQGRHVRRSAKSIPDMAGIREIEHLSNIPVSRRRRLFRTGQLVRVVDGPFAAFTGAVERLDSHGRLAILLDVFKRMVPLQLNEDQIEAVTG
jgi:transcriptional antiterminator NusG